MRGDMNEADVRKIESTHRQVEFGGDGSLSSDALSRCSTAEARALLSIELAQRLTVLPLGFIGDVSDGFVTCAVPVGYSAINAGDIRFALGREVRLVEVDPDVLARAIVVAYHGDSARLERDLESLRRADAAALPRMRLEGTDSFRLESSDAANFLATLLEYAIAQGASDLHLVPRREGTVARLRIRGELRQRDEPLCSLGTHTQLIGRLKVLARVDTTARFVPIDGAFLVPRPGGSAVSVRLSILPTIHGEKAVLRFMGMGEVPTLSELGYSPAAHAAIERFLNRREGAALFAGPTGSGKSTAIYAALGACVGQGRSVVSLEDPVELEVPGASQTTIDPERGLDYAVGLRAILRQDPDVIALGEIRDETSAAVALRAALTGHLVLSTVHARTAREVLVRLCDLGVDGSILEQSVRLVVCQRLVPTLCARCKVVDLAASLLHRYTVYRAVGCARCDYSGFGGRTLVAEVLELPSFGVPHGVVPPSEGPHRAGLRPELENLLRAGRIAHSQFETFVDWCPK